MREDIPDSEYENDCIVLFKECAGTKFGWPMPPKQPPSDKRQQFNVEDVDGCHIFE